MFKPIKQYKLSIWELWHEKPLAVADLQRDIDLGDLFGHHDIGDV